jgi:nicotinamide-nucleotide amidase
VLSTDVPMILDWLRREKLTLALAESCTGGMLAAELTAVPGSSDVIVGSAVCYQIKAKHKVLGIDSITSENVVSRSTAEKMAAATRSLFGASIGIGTTGFLDAGHSSQGPHAYWALLWPGFGDEPLQEWRRLPFHSDVPRSMNRELVVLSVLGYLATLAESR